LALIRGVHSTLCWAAQGAWLGLTVGERRPHFGNSVLISRFEP